MRKIRMKCLIIAVSVAFSYIYSLGYAAEKKSIHEVQLLEELKAQLDLQIERLDSVVQAIPQQPPQVENFHQAIRWQEQAIDREIQNHTVIKNLAAERQKLLRQVPKLTPYAQQLEQLDQRLEVLLDQELGLLRGQLVNFEDASMAYQRRDLTALQRASQRQQILRAQYNNLVRQVLKVLRRQKKLLKDVDLRLEQEARNLRTRIQPQLYRGSGQIVKSFKPIEVPFPRPRPNDLKKSSVIRPNDRPSFRLPELPVIPEWIKAARKQVTKEVKKTPSKAGELVITAVGGEPYLKVFKIGVHLKDEAISSIQKAVDLSRRGFPEPESTEFLESLGWGQFRRFVEDWTGVPAAEAQTVKTSIFGSSGE